MPIIGPGFAGSTWFCRFHLESWPARLPGFSYPQPPNLPTLRNAIVMPYLIPGADLPGSLIVAGCPSLAAARRQADADFHAAAGGHPRFCAEPSRKGRPA